MLEHRLPGAIHLPRRAASCGHRDSREERQRVEDLTDFIHHSVLAAFSNSSQLIKSKEKHAGMNNQISIYTRMAITKRVLDCRIGIIQLTLKFKFDILATMEILTGAVNLQISEAFSIPFLSELAKFPSSIQNFY